MKPGKTPSGHYDILPAFISHCTRRTIDNRRGKPTAKKAKYLLSEKSLDAPLRGLFHMCMYSSPNVSIWS